MYKGCTGKRLRPAAGIRVPPSTKLMSGISPGECDYVGIPTEASQGVSRGGDLNAGNSGRINPVAVSTC